MEIVKIKEVKPNPNNPRLIKDDKFKKLVKSIKEFPEMLKLRPIVVNDDMVVLGGNMRLKACKEAGLKEVPILKASNFTEKQQREFIIKDNVGFGEWDWDLIANEWDIDKLEDWGLGLPIDNNAEIEDIKEILEFNESINFIVKCDNINQLEQLQTKLNTSTQKISCKDFLIKSGL